MISVLQWRFERERSRTVLTKLNQIKYLRQPEIRIFKNKVISRATDLVSLEHALLFIRLAHCIISTEMLVEEHYFFVQGFVGFFPRFVWRCLLPRNRFFLTRTLSMKNERCTLAPSSQNNPSLLTLCNAIKWVGPPPVTRCTWEAVGLELQLIQ